MMAPSHGSITLADALEALSPWPSILTARQVEEATGRSRSTIRRRVASGELRVLRTRVGRGGRWSFLKQDVARWLVAMSS